MATHLLTGAAGFIAARVAEFLLAAGHTVIGVDNLNDACDVRPKQWRQAQLDFRPLHPADVPATWADIGKAERLLGWRPQTSFRDGAAALVEWYRENRAWAKDVATI
ncbi:MAG: NAD-dependent epimerase/dehydratase family protein [Planctomycetes bacterium]|nr:NAD-dependent epimerase/dehydratase family protein [Planctomycetota bacterium]